MPPMRVMVVEDSVVICKVLTEVLSADCAIEVAGSAADGSIALNKSRSSVTFDWNLFNANGGGLVTQVAGASATSSTQQDGYASGSLLSFTIGSDGVIQGIFSNGQTSPLGQIALASFSNEH
jgi:flagellar hook protein FlgE